MQTFSCLYFATFLCFINNLNVFEHHEFQDFLVLQLNDSSNVPRCFDLDKRRVRSPSETEDDVEDSAVAGATTFSNTLDLDYNLAGTSKKPRNRKTYQVFFFFSIEC